MGLLSVAEPRSLCSGEEPKAVAVRGASGGWCACHILGSGRTGTPEPGPGWVRRGLISQRAPDPPSARHQADKARGGPSAALCVDAGAAGPGSAVRLVQRIVRRPLDPHRRLPWWSNTGPSMGHGSWPACARRDVVEVPDHQRAGLCPPPNPARRGTSRASARRCHSGRSADRIEAQVDSGRCGLIWSVMRMSAAALEVNRSRGAGHSSIPWTSGTNPAGVRFFAITAHRSEAIASTRRRH